MLSIFKKHPPKNDAPLEAPVAVESPAWPLESAEDGELLLDIVDAPDKLIIRSTIAGAEIADIEIHIHDDLLTIRGKREDELPEASIYLYRECYFGPFSRSIILPHPIKEDSIEATLKNGVLTIMLPKKEVDANIKIKEER